MQTPRWSLLKLRGFRHKYWTISVIRHLKPTLTDIDMRYKLLVSVSATVVLLALFLAWNMPRGVKPEAAVRRPYDIILDVRTIEEWQAGHYPTAVHIELADLTEQAAAARLEKGQGILVVCRSGARAKEAATRLRAYGYRRVDWLEGSHIDLA
jgi:rhodanese-related sulfurtransferase